MKIYTLFALTLIACGGSVAQPIERRLPSDGSVDGPYAGEGFGEDGSVDPSEPALDASSPDSSPDSSADAGLCDFQTFCADRGFNCGSVRACNTDVNCGSCAGALCGDNGKANVCGTTCQHDQDIAQTACAGTGKTNWAVPVACQNGAPWKVIGGNIVQRDDGLNDCIIRAVGNQQFRCCGGL